ncbi:MAG: hypothetical protein ACTSU2_00655 [Promethearchaeota archaeon]
MNSKDQPENLDHIIKILTNDFLNKISSVNSTNIGIYKVLKILYEEADIKELGIFIAIAENQPIKIETLIHLVSPKISKSTVYRKISEYEEKKLILKNEHNYLQLASKLKALTILSELNKLLRDNKD